MPRPVGRGTVHREGWCFLRRQLRAGVHVGRLLAGGGVDVEVAEEDLRVAGGRGSVLRVVVGLDVDGRGHGGLQAGEGCGLAVGAVHAVALGLGSQDHELEVRHRVRNAVQGDNPSIAVPQETRLNGEGEQIVVSLTPYSFITYIFNCEE